MIGSEIAHYKILAKLGGGGMGVVYRAEDTKLKRPVALKFLPPEWTRDDEAKARLMHEAQAASILDHNNICTIYEVNETDDGQLFIAMALYEGQTLKYRIDGNPIPVEEAVDLTLQMAAGLLKAHEKDIVHRDIKPANVFVTEDGVAKILDFGLAKSAGRTQLTKEGSTLGTAGYMSPEQGRGEAADERSDIWSLGVVLYEMLSGQMPFKGDYEQAVLYAILNETPDPITALRSGIPMEVERIVSKCLQKDPEARYQSVKDLMVDLKAVQEAERSGISRTQMAAPAPKTGNRTPILLAGLAAAVLLIVAGYLFLRPASDAISERVPIAVVDFVNETNEPELNGLSGMLITALEQSRRLSVMSRAQMLDLMEQMGQTDVTFVDEATGREIAKHARVQALAVASIRRFGELYTIDFKVIDPETGEHLFTAREEGRGQEDIPGMLDRLSDKTRIDLKEEADVVKMAHPGVADVTTTNLQAYHQYFLGEQAMGQIETEVAEEHYGRAIALDSTFALAYYGLADALTWTYGKEEQAKKALQKAMAMMTRMPEKEQYLVKAMNTYLERGFSASVVILKEIEHLYPNDKEILYEIGDGSFHALQYETAAAYLEKVVALDPKHEPALQHLTWSYRNLGQFDKMNAATDKLAAVNEREAYIERSQYHRQIGEYDAGIDNLKKAQKLDPTSTDVVNGLVTMHQRAEHYDLALIQAEKHLAMDPSPFSYFRLAETQRLSGDFSAALSTLEDGLKLVPGEVRLLRELGRIYGYQGDYSRAQTHYETMTRASQSFTVRRTGFEGLVDIYGYLGQEKQMTEALDQRIALAWSNSDSNVVARYTVEKAYNTWMLHQDPARILADIEPVTSFPNVTDEIFHLLLTAIYAEAGELDKAEQVANNLHVPGWEHFSDARIHAAKGQWRDVVSNLNEFSQLRPDVAALFRYQAAQAHFQLRQWDEAISQVQLAQTSYGGWHSHTYPLGFQLLGRIYEEKGEPQLASKNYRKFLDLWQDADPNLPDLIHAKARMAELVAQ